MKLQHCRYQTHQSHSNTIYSLLSPSDSSQPHDKLPPSLCTDRTKRSVQLQATYIRVVTRPLFKVTICCTSRNTQAGGPPLVGCPRLHIQACYHSLRNLLPPSLLSKNIKIKIYRTIILSFVLCGWETWSLTLREERRLRVFENRVLRRIFGPKRDE